MVHRFVIGIQIAEIRQPYLVHPLAFACEGIRPLRPRPHQREIRACADPLKRRSGPARAGRRIPVRGTAATKRLATPRERIGVTVSARTTDEALVRLLLAPLQFVPVVVCAGKSRRWPLSLRPPRARAVLPELRNGKANRASCRHDGHDWRRAKPGARPDRRLETVSTKAIAYFAVSIAVNRARRPPLHWSPGPPSGAGHRTRTGGPGQEHPHVTLRRRIRIKSAGLEFGAIRDLQAPTCRLGVERDADFES